MYLQTKPMDVLYCTLLITTTSTSIHTYILHLHRSQMLWAKSFTTLLFGSSLSRHVFQIVTALKGHFLEGIDNGTLIQIRRIQIFFCELTYQSLNEIMFH